MLLGADEYPFHQVTQTFAGAATSDPAWNDGHYVTAVDVAGEVSFAANVRLYANTNVLDGFVCLRHRDRQYNIRVSRTLRPDMDSLRVGPLRLEIIRPLTEVRLVLEPCEIAGGVSVALDVTCRSHTVSYMGPVETTRHEGRLLSERLTYELAGPCDGVITVGDETIEWPQGRARFFRNHSWGVQPGRGGPRLYGAPTPSRRAPGMRQWVLFDMEDHSGFFFVDPSGRAASGRGAILFADFQVPVVEVETDVELFDAYRRLRRASLRLTDSDGVVRSYEVESLGWLYCQGGGYFGGFNDGLGQGVYRGPSHAEGEVWDVSHPVEIKSGDGTKFRFDHDWAETFVAITDGQGVRGLGHYECVVIT